MVFATKYSHVLVISPSAYTYKNALGQIVFCQIKEIRLDRDDKYRDVGGYSVFLFFGVWENIKGHKSTMNRRCQCHLIIDYRMDEWYPMSYPKMPLKHERLLAIFFCHIAHCSYFYLKNLFRNLCTCFHFLPVLSWTPLGSQRNTWFLLHFLGVRPKGISTMSVIFCLVGLCHKVFTEAFDLWALTIGIVPSHGTQFDSWIMCLTMPSFLIIVVISSNMIQNCFIWFHNYKGWLFNSFKDHYLYSQPN